MKILVTGADGQLGQCFKKLFLSQDEIDKLSLDPSEYVYVLMNRSQFDIVGDNIYGMLSDMKIDVVINCAAYTNTDGAEENRDACFMANTYGPLNLAIACNQLGIKLIHISTDFVFDGSGNTPYKEDDKCNPISVYGSTKYLGELSIRNALSNHVIIRTSWLYSEFGKNFLTKTLDILREGKERPFVYDQIGSPTYAMNLARFILAYATRPEVTGTFNFTDSGIASRYDFAKEIEMLYFGTDKGMVSPCLSDTFKSKVKRPAYSVLSGDKTENTFGLRRTDWKSALLECMGNMFFRSEDIVG